MGSRSQPGAAATQPAAAAIAANPVTRDTNDQPAAAAPRTGQRAVVSALAPLLTAVIVTVWIFRDVLFRGRLFGGTGDARWTIAVHEHWYQFWRGNESLTDLHYYYPVQGTLGMSDAFFVQGQLYSTARFFGVGVVNSWVVAQFLFSLIGAIGVAVLGRKILRSVWSQVAFVALTCASYPVIVQSDHVQLIGFLAASWIFVGLYDLITLRHPKTGVAVLLVVPPMLALSSWYAFVLTGLVLLVLAGFAALFAGERPVIVGIGRVARATGRALWSPVGGVLLICGVAGWLLVVKVYLPSLGLLPSGSWDQVTFLSPRWSDILNATASGGGVWSWLYAKWFDPATAYGEQAFGFTPILFCGFVFFGFFQIRSGLLHRPAPVDAEGRPGRPQLVAMWFTVITVIGFFLIDERGLSLYRFFWFHVPGLESIRAAFRVQTLLYGMAFFLVLRSLELWWRGSVHWRSRARWRTFLLPVGAFSLLLVIFVEMQRPVYTLWTRPELLKPALLAQQDALRQSCDAMILIDEIAEDESFVNVVDAVILSTVSGVPTPQGYSSGDPIGHPGPNADPASLANWMLGQGFHGRLCTVSSQGVQVISNS
jgi:hypothetical protein